MEFLFGENQIVLDLPPPSTVIKCHFIGLNNETRDVSNTEYARCLDTHLISLQIILLNSRLKINFRPWVIEFWLQKILWDTGSQFT